LDEEIVMGSVTDEWTGFLESCMKSKDKKVRGFRREGKAILSVVPEAWVIS